MDAIDPFAQPSCAVCGTVMRDHPKGWECGACGHLEDHSAELAAIEIPDVGEVPGIHGG